MSTPATEAATTEVAPAAPASGAGASAATEPVAAEPTTASEPAATEPTPYASPDSFNFEEWDGASDGLPEEVRGWYSQFETRFNAEREGLAKAHTEALSGIQGEADQYKRMYNAVFDGAEDPRIAELTGHQQALQSEFDEARLKWQDSEAAYKSILEASADQYLSMVKATHGDQLSGLTPEDREVMYDLLDSFELHQALELVALGEEATTEAKSLIEAGANQELAMRVIASEFKAKPQTTTQVVEAQKQARRPKNHPSRVVAGSEPQQSASPPTPADIKRMPIADQRRTAAIRAIKAERTRSR